MAFAVESLLSLDGLKGIEVAAGKSGLKRSIKWVTILEVLDELNFLDEGDLLVTTGYGLSEDPILQEKLIPYLVNKKLAGIAFQPGFSLVEIPKTILDKANELDFPVLYLPKDLSFGQLTRQILRNLINHQFHLLEYSERIYNKLTQMVLNNSGLDAIAQSLVEMIQRPVLFFDLFYNTMVSALPEGVTIENWKDINVLLQKSPSYPGSKSRVVYTKDKKQLILNPITTGSNILGYLCVINKNSPLEEMDKIAIGHAATLAALIMLKESAVKETENQLKEYFLEETLKGNIISPQILLKKAAALGYDCKSGYHILLINFVNWHKITETMKDREIHCLKNSILLVLEHCISQHGISYLHKFTHNNLLLLIQVKNHTSVNKIVNIAKQIKDMIVSKNKDLDFISGISSYYIKLENIESAHQESIRALEIGKKFNNSITLFSEIEIYNLFYEIADKKFSKIFYQETLGILLKYDYEHNTNLVNTLEKYFQCNYNLQETASSLYIHRHTLKYRLQRIKEISGLDPQKYEDRLKLQIALILSKVINHK